MGKDQTKYVSFTSANQVSPHLKFLEEIHDAAQLLVSCLHSWGLDPEIDETCITRLGLLQPVKPVSFGLLTHRKLSLIVPGWYSNSAGTSEQNVPGGKHITFQSYMTLHKRSFRHFVDNCRGKDTTFHES